MMCPEDWSADEAFDMSFRDFSSPAVSALGVRVCENFFGIQISPSGFIREGHIALSDKRLRVLGLHLGEQVFVRRCSVSFSEGMVVDEMRLEWLKDGQTGVEDGLFAESGYALISEDKFGSGRNKFVPGERVTIYRNTFETVNVIKDL